jgi:hypothetical protein
MKYDELMGAHGGVVVTVAGSRPDAVIDFFFFFSIFVILPASLRPGVYSASSKNEYQRQKSNVSEE